MQLHGGDQEKLDRPVIVIRGRDADRLMSIVNMGRQAIARIRTEFPIGAYTEVSWRNLARWRIQDSRGRRLPTRRMGRKVTPLDLPLVNVPQNYEINWIALFIGNHGLRYLVNSFVYTLWYFKIPTLTYFIVIQDENNRQYFDMGIFLAFFVLFCIVCVIIILKLKWRSRSARQLSLTTLAKRTGMDAQ